MKLKTAGTFLLVFFCYAIGPATADYVQLPGAVQVHSTVSSGLYSMEDLVTLAKEMGLEVLVMTDHDLVALEYGISPFRNLIKKRVERTSVLKFGPEKYLSTISQINQRQKDVLVIPGVQSSPFYYWTGSPLGEDLTAYSYQKGLLLIGMMSADDYRDLPLLNRGFSTRYIKELLPQGVVFLCSFILGIYLIFQYGYLKKAGFIIALLSVILLINHHPFQSSRFDAYHGDQGIAPYQDLIDYVNKRGGLTFWINPESNYSKSETTLGPIRLMTMPYPESLQEARDYTGFSAMYNDTITITDPGKKWDQLLNDYCSGRRRHPVWGIAGANFVGEAGGVKLDTFQTIFLTKGKSVLNIIDALAKGRMYAKRKEKGGGLRLDSFSVKDANSGETAIMGAELSVSSYPIIRAKVASDDQVEHPVRVLLVKGGIVLHQFEGETPLEFVIDDKSPWVSKSYYRLEVQGGPAGKLLTNPIFVDRKIALTGMMERPEKSKESGVDKTQIMEKETAAPVSPERKQKSYPEAPASKIGKSLPVTLPAGSIPPDKKVETGNLMQLPIAESKAPVKAVAPDTQGLIPQLPDSQLKITVPPVPYSIQVESFSSFAAAQKSLRDYQKFNLPVYHVRVNLGDKGTWWRLYIGYFATQEEAMTARETYKLSGAIVQKTPYANLVDIYTSPYEMAAMRLRLEAMGYSPYVIRTSSDCYHLYAGAFLTLNGAKDLQRELRTKCIGTDVVMR